MKTDECNLNRRMFFHAQTHRQANPRDCNSTVLKQKVMTNNNHLITLHHDFLYPKGNQIKFIILIYSQPC